jgi:hypothetical protein
MCGSSLVSWAGCIPWRTRYMTFLRVHASAGADALAYENLKRCLTINENELNLLPTTRSLEPVPHVLKYLFACEASNLLRKEDSTVLVDSKVVCLRRVSPNFPHPEAWTFVQSFIFIHSTISFHSSLASPANSSIMHATVWLSTSMQAISLGRESRFLGADEKHKGRMARSDRGRRLPQVGGTPDI